eukprot:gene1976-1434_t
MDILQWVLKIAKTRLSTSTDTTRARDHELLAILRHFDQWDTNVEPSPSTSSSSSSVSEGRRVVCMLGEDIRPHLLLTFASFTTVRAVHYIFLHGASHESSPNPQWGLPFLSSNAMAVIAEKLPPGKVIKATHVTMEKDENSAFLQQLAECSVVVLPSDKEVASYPASLSLEIWQYVETYLDHWSSTATTHGPPSSSSSSSWSVLQIILTPHVAYGARLVPSSLSKQHHRTGSHEITWQLSYVVVLLEQEWYFRTVQQALVGAVPLLQDAAAVWTFSPVQRDVVRRIYAQQWQEQRQEQRQMGTPPEDLEVEVVPIFAPCAPSMPCHIAFEPPSPSPSPSPSLPSVVPYELVFFGHDVGGERSRFLATLQPQLAVALPSLRFSPRMPSMMRAHRPATVEGEEEAAAAAAVEKGEEDESLLPLVGRARDVVMLSRSTIALNLRMHALSVLEMHRLAYLLSMGKCIVSQRGRDPSLTSLSMLEGAVYFVDTVDDVVATLQFLLTPTDDTDSNSDRDDVETVETDATSRPLSTKAADWIVQAHGRYQRLARCEQRSLAAYRAIHTLFNQTTMTATVMATGDGDGSIEAPQPQPMYSTVALERAMQRLLSKQRPQLNRSHSCTPPGHAAMPLFRKQHDTQHT